MQPQQQAFAGYQWDKSYEQNYRHVPIMARSLEVPPCPGDWSFCGRKVASPLGIAAGPLLNGDWILYYAALGFDVLTYKTVRSKARACYELPNLQPVAVDQVTRAGSVLSAAAKMQGSWAVSFGMPSQPPEVWRKDVERTRQQLPAGKLLSVSVVATAEADWSIDQVADDYALCARWAVQSGADAVECNFSCPNVQSCDGQLYQQPALAGLVAQRVRESIGRQIPLLVKVGYLEDAACIAELCRGLAPHVDALVMTNCIPARVKDAAGESLFGGESRGIGGSAIRTASVLQVRRFAEAIESQGLPLTLIGVGVIATADHVRQYLAAGAESVQLATAAMLDPTVALAIRAEFSPNCQTAANPS